MGFEALPDNVEFVILCSDDALCERLDEIDVFAPCGKNVLCADLSSHIIGIVMAH